MPAPTSEWTDDAALAFARYVHVIMSGGDLVAIQALLHPEFRVWQNTDGLSMNAPQSGAFHADMAQLLGGFEFRDVRVRALHGGYVEQHVKHMVDLAGKAYAVPSCLVFSLREQQLWQVEEYMDGAHLPPQVVALRLQYR